MKKHLLTFGVMLALCSGSMASSPSLFKKQKAALAPKQSFVRTLTGQSSNPYQQRGSAQVYVPQYQDYSYWDSMNQNWIESYKEDRTYTMDGKLSVSITKEFTTNDTLSRTTYQYNASGKETEILTESYGGAGVFIPMQRTLFTYSGNKTIATSQNRSNNAWVDNQRQTISIDEFDNTTIELREQYNTVNLQWEIMSGYITYIEYRNDNSGKMTLVIDSSYNQTTHIWEADYKRTYTYNASAQATEVTDAEYTGSAWEDVSKELYFYDGAGVLNRAEIKEYDTQTQTWKNESELVNISWLNWNGNVPMENNINTGYTENVWNGTSYEPSYRYAVTFPDAYGSRTGLEEMYINNQWTPAYRDIEEYDSHFNPTLYSYEEWNNNAWEKQYSEKNDFQYDGNGNMTEVINAFWNSNTLAYQNNEKIRFGSFILVNTGVSKDKASYALEVYPNPANGNTNIKFALNAPSTVNVEVYNLVGQKISSIINNVSLNSGTFVYPVEGLEAGMYVVKISVNGNTESKKLIIN